MSAPATPAGPIQVTTFYIVPVVKTQAPPPPPPPSQPPPPPPPPPPSQSQLCLYFNQNWQIANPSDPPINLPSGSGVNFVGFVQAPVWQAQPHIPSGYEIASGVTLLAAVAKTLTPSNQTPSTPQPNVFVASTSGGNPSVILPVCNNTQRGVILIFMSPDGVNVAKLLATSDPEISNSTGVNT